jgi:hypothetical protein
MRVLVPIGDFSRISASKPCATTTTGALLLVVAALTRLLPGRRMALSKPEAAG